MKRRVSLLIVVLFCVNTFAFAGGGEHEGYSPPPTNDTIIDRITAMNRQNRDALNNRGGQVERLLTTVHLFGFEVGKPLDTLNYAQHTYNAQAIDTEDVYMGFAYYGSRSSRNILRKSNYTIAANGLVTQETQQMMTDGQGDWKNFQKLDYTYNSLGELTFYALAVWDENADQWQPSQQTQCSYNDQGLLLSFATQQWLRGQWEPYLTVNRTYDYQGNLLTEEALNNNYGVFGNYRKTINTYDANSHLTSWTEQLGNPIGKTWYNYRQELLAYSSGNLTSDLWQTWSTHTAGWENDKLTKYTYINNNLISALEQRWNTAFNNWRNYTLVTNTYSGHQKTSSSLQAWNYDNHNWVLKTVDKLGYGTDNQLVDDSTYGPVYGSTAVGLLTIAHNTYDAQGRPTQQDMYGWSNSRVALYPSGRTTYQYDGNSNKTYQLVEGYDTTTNSFYDMEAYQYSYQTLTVTGIGETNFVDNLKLFPNPAHHEMVLLRFTLINPAPVTINVFDNMGRLVLTQTNNYTDGYNIAPINTTSFATGLYLVQYENTNNHTRGNLKLVVE